MAKSKKIPKKVVDVKTGENEVISSDDSLKPVEKDIQKSEDKMLFWIFLFIGIVFASILIPYFWNESGKAFEFSGINWSVEDYDDLRIFHGRFVSLTNPNLYYNIFLRTDPRENDIDVSGKLDSFKYGGIVSLTPKVDRCRGDLSRVMLDLSAFLEKGVGVGHIESGSIDEHTANESARRFATCENVLDRTVVIVDIGESRVVQDELNPNCYTIYAKDCGDSAVVEKFMVKSVEDFRDTNKVD